MVKIKGESDFIRTTVVTLSSGVEVTVNGLPFGYAKDMEADLPSPTPPQRIKKDLRGNPIIKDKTTKESETFYDKQDPEYKRKVNLQGLRQAAWMVYHGTQKDPELEWESNPEDFQDREAFFQSIYDEIKTAHIGGGDIDKLVEHILLMSGVTPEQVEALKDHFLAAKAEAMG